MTSAQHDICAICLEQPKTPKSLQTCTHLFCEACLNSYVERHQAEKSVACPTCTIACPIQDIKVEAPDDAESSSVPTTKELCTFCSYKGNEAKAEFFCDSCLDVLLCRDCAVNHGTKASSFRGHVAKPLSDFMRLERCEKHGGRAMKFLCIGCDTPACEVCVAIGHDGHELVDIGDVLKKLKDNFESLDDAYECASTLQRELQDVQNQEEAVITQIQNQASLMKREIDTRSDVLVTAVRAKTGGKQLAMDVCALVENLEGLLKRGRDVSTVGITNAEHVRSVLSTETTLNKARADAEKTLAAFKNSVHDISVPIFVQKKDIIVVGELVYLQRARTDPVRLELGGRYSRKPCYKIGKVVTFFPLKDKARKRAIAFFEENGPRSNLQMGLSELLLAGTFDNAVDMIVHNNGKLIILAHSRYSSVPEIGWPRFRYIKVVSSNGAVENEINLETALQLGEALSLAATKSEQYVLLTKRSNGHAVYILADDFSLVKGPIELENTMLPSEESGAHSSLKILCPQSADLLLIHDRKRQQVSAISLEVKHASMDLFDVGSIGHLQHYIVARTPILPPVKGFYILDICCDGGKVYLCIKKGARTAQSSEAGPIQFYQATYTNDKWQYTAIPLEGPTGKPFSELKKDEMLQLGAHKGTLMCFVYSPIPLAELKESKEPGMNATWYHGKLP